MVEFEKRLSCVIKADGTIIRGLRPFLSASFASEMRSLIRAALAISPAAISPTASFMTCRGADRAQSARTPSGGKYDNLSFFSASSASLHGPFRGADVHLASRPDPIGKAAVFDPPLGPE